MRGEIDEHFFGGRSFRKASQHGSHRDACPLHDKRSATDIRLAVEILVVVETHVPHGTCGSTSSQRRSSKPPTRMIRFPRRRLCGSRRAVLRLKNPPPCGKTAKCFH